MTPEDFIKRYEKVLSQQSWEAIESFIDDHAVVTFSEGTYVGKSEVKKAFELLTEHLGPDPSE